MGTALYEKMAGDISVREILLSLVVEPTSCYPLRDVRLL